MGQSSFVEVRDYQIWAKHIHGNDSLKRKILSMKAGDLVELDVNGFRGVWKKMENNQKSGESVDGIKPFGKARAAWHRLYTEQCGELVPIKSA